MSSGIIGREYRVGYFGPQNEALADNIKHQLHAIEYAEEFDEEQAEKFVEKYGKDCVQHDKERKKIIVRRPVKIKLIDLSDSKKFDEFKYQCDTIVYDMQQLINGDEEAQKALDNIIEANKNIDDESTGKRNHNSARIISIYHEEYFSPKKAEETREETRKKTEEARKEFLKGYKAKFSKFFESSSTPCIDITESSLVTDLLPEFIVGDMEIARLEFALSEKEDPTKVISNLAAKIDIAMDNKNPYTRGHSIRVGHFTRLLAEAMRFEFEDEKPAKAEEKEAKTAEQLAEKEFKAMFPYGDFNKDFVRVPLDETKEGETKYTYKFSEEFIELLAAMAMAHDIGKIAIPNQILDKPGGLDPSEREIMNVHAAIGGKLIEESAMKYPLLQCLKDAVESHHETYNGIRGYPHGLKDKMIPFIARMICIADSFDAMTTARSYNEPKTFEEAIIEVAACAGTQFDPDIAYSFLKAICMPHSITNEENKEEEVVQPSLTSKEGFEAFKAHFGYDYTNPPTFDGEKNIKIPARNYEPNYNAIQAFANTYLQSKEKFMQFVDKIQVAKDDLSDDDLRVKRDKGVRKIIYKVADIKKALSTEKDSATRAKLEKELEHYQNMRAKSSESILKLELELTQGLTEEAVAPLYTDSPQSTYDVSDSVDSR